MSISLRTTTFLFSVAASIALITALTFTIGDGAAGVLLLDSQNPLYPLSVQNAMWIMFGVGLGEVWVRYHQGASEMAQCRMSYLPEDDKTMLRSGDLGLIYKRVEPAGKVYTHFLPRLIARTILQFESSRSVDNANSLLNSSLELMQHEIDLKYNMLRYVVWVIPTLGFIGTVIGIALALADAQGMNLGDPNSARATLIKVTQSLGVAFNTTLLALVQSAILVFLMHIAQELEEGALNRSGHYCLDNLINRLYEK